MTKNLDAALFRSIVIASILMFSLPAQAQVAAANWSWLLGTYWYVPKDYLPALATFPSLPAPVAVDDQTVYRIDGYANGYFWGPTAVSYSRNLSEAGAPSCLRLVGSVTPQGRLHLTFIPDGSPSDAVVGIGMMVMKGGAWTMENQMSSLAGDNVLLSHWAYMYQCKRGEHCFSSLPGVRVSIPEFLGACTGSSRH